MKSSKVVTLLGVMASSASLAQAVTFAPQVDIDFRFLDEIYAAAQRESGALQVFWGGDGECIDGQY